MQQRGGDRCSFFSIVRNAAQREPFRRAGMGTEGSDAGFRVVVLSMEREPLQQKQQVMPARNPRPPRARF